MDQHFVQIHSANWQFAATLRGQYISVDYTQACGPGTEHARKLAGLVAAWGEVEALAQIQCGACNGYGHVARNCETRRRLTLAHAGNNAAKNRLASARSIVEIFHAAHVRGRPVLPLNQGAAALRAAKRARKAGSVRPNRNIFA